MEVMVQFYGSVMVQFYGSVMVQFYGSMLVQFYGSMLVQFYGSVIVQRTGLQRGVVSRQGGHPRSIRGSTVLCISVYFLTPCFHIPACDW